MTRFQRTQTRFRSYSARLGLVVGGLLLGWVAVEICLAALGLPRFHKSHSAPSQFETKSIGDRHFYLNKRSGNIQFVYDSNPRGYFGRNNEVDHHINSSGFRGPEFQRQKSPNTLRLMFLGDSFTFGEGVHFEHTYAEVAAARLREALPTEQSVEACNFGVGGYNTTQSLELLQLNVKIYSPDIVVLGYVLNDAEPPLFYYESDSKTFHRRPREHTVPEGLSDDVPPERWLFRLRSARLMWQFLQNRRRTRVTIAHYRSLYQPTSPGWLESRRALRQISRICQKRDIRFYVVLFPILYDLTEEYPFRDIHDQIARAVDLEGATFIDLFPHVQGMKERDLWVHPTDQHPNEKVHAIAGVKLAEEVLRHETGLREPKTSAVKESRNHATVGIH